MTYKPRRNGVHKDPVGKLVRKIKLTLYLILAAGERLEWLEYSVSLESLEVDGFVRATGAQSRRFQLLRHIVTIKQGKEVLPSLR